MKRAILALLMVASAASAADQKPIHVYDCLMSNGRTAQMDIYRNDNVGLTDLDTQIEVMNKMVIMNQDEDSALFDLINTRGEHWGKIAISRTGGTVLAVGESIGTCFIKNREAL